MSVLDNIAQERQRLAERLATIDANRAKLAEQLVDLEAAERVLARFTQTGSTRRRRAAKIATMSLNDATLRAVETHGRGISATEIRGYLASEFGLQVRANHL